MTAAVSTAAPTTAERILRAVLLAILTLLPTVPLTAQESTQRTVRVRVTAVAGRDSVFLDQGREAGLRPGLEVELYPPAAAPLRVVVRDLSASSCRATLLGGRSLPPVGTPGECEVDDEDDDRTEAAPRRATEPPSHPPWSA